MNLVDARAKPAQTALLDIAREHPLRPHTCVPRVHVHPHDLTTLRLQRGGQSAAMPHHHEVRAENIDLKRLGGVLAVAYERDLHDFAELLLLENLGPRTLQSLA